MFKKLKRMFSGKSKSSRNSVTPFEEAQDASSKANSKPETTPSTAPSQAPPVTADSVAGIGKVAAAASPVEGNTVSIPESKATPPTKPAAQADPIPQQKPASQPKKPANIDDIPEIGSVDASPQTKAGSAQPPIWIAQPKPDVAKLPPIAPVTNAVQCSVPTGDSLNVSKKITLSALEPEKEHQDETKKAHNIRSIDINSADTELLKSMFGSETVSQLQHESWEQRKELIKAAEESIMQPHKIKDPARMFRAACMLLEFLLVDKTQPIIMASLGFLENLISTIGQKVDAQSLKSSVLPIMSLIIGKTTSTNTRIRESSGQALTLLATQTVLGPTFITTYLVEPIKGKATPAVVFGRGSLVLTMLDSFGTSLQPFEPYIDLCQKFLDHPDHKSRQMGVDVIRKLRGLTNPTEYKKLESRLSDSAFKALHIAEGDTAALHAEDAKPKESRPKVSMLTVDSSEAFRANKNSVSWAINDPQPTKPEPASPPKAKPPKAPRNPDEAVLSKKPSDRSRSSVSSYSTRASSSTSNGSTFSTLTPEEEDLMNDIECRY